MYHHNRVITPAFIDQAASQSDCPGANVGFAPRGENPFEMRDAFAAMAEACEALAAKREAARLRLVAEGDPKVSVLRFDREAA